MRRRLHQVRDELVHEDGLTVIGVVAAKAVHGGHALTNWVEQLLRHTDIGHHVLEDQRLVLQFRPLAGRERSSRPANRVVHRLAHVVHAVPPHRQTRACDTGSYTLHSQITHPY